MNLKKVSSPYLPRGDIESKAAVRWCLKLGHQNVGPNMTKPTISVQKYVYVHMYMYDIYIYIKYKYIVYVRYV